jgi:hypothetical protein
VANATTYVRDGGWYAISLGVRPNGT